MEEEINKASLMIRNEREHQADSTKILPSDSRPLLRVGGGDLFEIQRDST